MRLSRRRRERLVELDMTPMIDVVFQLLIFFLVSAQMVHLTRADIELPQEQGEQNEQPEQAGLVINLTANGEIIVADRTVELNELDSLVREAIRQTASQDPEKLKLIIRADRHAAASDLNQIIERLHSMGVGVARIATSPIR